jgi:uncharacterized membrane protein (GlpM family)
MPSMPSNIVSILISLISQTINFIITSLISLYPILQIPYDVETSRDTPKSYLNSLNLTQQEPALKNQNYIQ